MFKTITFKKQKSNKGQFHWKLNVFAITLNTASTMEA